MVQAARKSGRHRVRDAAIILMMFRHGLRTAELVALRWQQVDLKAGYLDVHRVKQGHDSKHPLRGPQLRLLRNCSGSILNRRMCSFRSEKHLFRHAPFVRLWREWADWPSCPLFPIRTNCVMRVAITWRQRAMTPERFRII